MSDNLSLADRAIETLAAIKSMGDGLGLDHPERHVVRDMKRLAERIVGDALDVAFQLTLKAEYISEFAREIESSKPEAQP